MSDDEGLSPRVRGNPITPLLGPPAVRSIPACAGEPWSCSVAAAIVMVYPRVCGGTALWPAPRTCGGGLSPRVRGNPSASTRARRIMGSIPACAGEPMRPPIAVPMIKVYPRVCGGTHPACLPAARTPGLSPRVRGNPKRMTRTVFFIGSIPACAGEPAMPICRAAARMVYPRVCGGTSFQLPMMPTYWGLSPRVRGNQRFSQVR